MALVLCRCNTLLIVLEALGLSATGKLTDADKVVNPEQTSGSESRVIQKSGLNSHITLVLAECYYFTSVCLSVCLSVTVMIELLCNTLFLHHWLGCVEYTTTVSTTIIFQILLDCYSIVNTSTFDSFGRDACVFMS